MTNSDSNSRTCRLRLTSVLLLGIPHNMDNFVSISNGLLKTRGILSIELQSRPIGQKIFTPDVRDISSLR